MERADTWLSAYHDEFQLRQEQTLTKELGERLMWFAIGLEPLPTISDLNREFAERLGDDPSAAGSLVTPSRDVAPWPPDLGWHFRPGEAAFLGKVFEISGRHHGVLEVLASSNSAVSSWTIIQGLDEDKELETKTIRGYISQVRAVLREAFNLAVDFDPIPNVDTGQRTAWKLDSEGISRAAQKHR